MRDRYLTEYVNELSSWIPSQNGSEFCQFSDLSEDMRSQLRQEDKYTTTIHGFRYTVKDYEGKWLVFRREVTIHNPGKKLTQYPTNIHEIKVIPLREANEYLLSKNLEYQIFGSDPVKVINNEVYVVMAKYNQQCVNIKKKDIRAGCWTGML